MTFADGSDGDESVLLGIVEVQGQGQNGLCIGDRQGLKPVPFILRSQTYIYTEFATPGSSVLRCNQYSTKSI